MLIQNIECEIPSAPPLGAIDGYKRKQKDQYFRRTEQPKHMEDIEFDAEGDPIYTPEQRKFALREIDRCRDGYWFMNNGVATYVNGAYYFWLNYWYLEDGVQPEYRECDRLFFLFFVSCYKNPYIACIIRGKARREGATSHGTCIEVWIATNAAGFGGNKRCGNISKTGDDVDDMFEQMLVPGYKRLPIFLRPRTDGPDDPKKEILFRKPGAKKQQKATTDISRHGLNSIITKRDTTLNAYDSGRWSFILIDEGGKWLKVNIIKYWRIVKDVLVKGASRVGFAYMPSTVNPPDKGGDNFKRLWQQADQFKYPINKLPQQMVKYFKPAFDGLNGFIDRYGFSVIEKPDEETLKYLIEKNQELTNDEERVPDEFLCMGARAYLNYRLDILEDEADKSEEKRKYPQQEDDMFDFGDIMSPLDLDKIKAQIKNLVDNPVPWRRGTLVPVREVVDGREIVKIEFFDNQQGHWMIKDFPKIPNHYVIEEYGNMRVAKPMSTFMYGGGADTYRFDKTQQLGSKGVIVIGDKMDHSGEGGEIQAMYVGRPKLTELFWKELMMACMWYGCTITVEKDATQEYIKYFQNKMTNVLNCNCLPMLGKKPDVTIDTTRKKQSGAIEYGVSSADPFTFAKEIELLQIYVFKHVDKIKLIQILEALMKLDIEDRTKSDIAIGVMMFLLNIIGDFQQRKKEAPKAPLVQMYNVNKGGMFGSFGM